MATYNVKPLEHYIDKHGEFKGTNIWQRETTKAAKYQASPYQRLTQEWFVWRYGNEEGLKRFEIHASKSVQSLENFIKRYGEEAGTKMYHATIAKKNTVKQVQQKYSKEEAAAKLEDWYATQKASFRKFFNSLTPEQRAARAADSSAKTKKTRIERYGGITFKDVLKTKYPDDWEVKYAAYRKTLFPTTPCHPSKESLKVIQPILDAVPEAHRYCMHGFDPRGEYKLSTEHGNFMIDFTFILNDVKLALEYDGAMFHPTKNQSDQYGETKMPIGKMTYREKYERDCLRNREIESAGFKLCIIRSDDTQLVIEEKINQFVKEIKSVLLN